MPGPYAKYLNTDIFRAFLLLEKETGRFELSKALYIGEGVTRTILRQLKNRNLIASTKRGHELSSKGKRYLNEIKRLISWKPRFDYYIPFYTNREKSLIIVKRPNFIVPYKLRDYAVSMGAEGALIFLYTNKRLIMPPDKDERKEYNTIKEMISPKEGDLIAITFGGNRYNVENGAIKIAVESCRRLEKIFKKIAY